MEATKVIVEYCKKYPHSEKAEYAHIRNKEGKYLWVFYPFGGGVEWEFRNSKKSPKHALCPSEIEQAKTELNLEFVDSFEEEVEVMLVEDRIGMTRGWLCAVRSDGKYAAAYNNGFEFQEGPQMATFRYIWEAIAQKESWKIVTEFTEKEEPLPESFTLDQVRKIMRYTLDNPVGLDIAFDEAIRRVITPKTN